MGDLRPVSLYRSCTKRGREELSRPIYPDNLKRARAGNRRHQDFQSRSERRAAYLIRPQAYLLARRHRIKTDGGGSCRIERCKYGASRPAPHGFLTALACSSRLASRLMSATDSSASSGESSINQLVGTRMPKREHGPLEEEHHPPLLVLVALVGAATGHLLPPGVSRLEKR